ncbi:MAG: malate/lactate/ureidoglycolate dehydrogenase [Hyphomicrobiaceae bacterium]|nr:malate/lactate/ureidoglycolate dehydrogenase [Hyphomicrobiaceae bacterium]
MVTIKADALSDLVRDIFAKAGCSAAEAERIGRYLVSANLTGHDSHGVVRVPRYLAWKSEGAVKADQTVKVLTETPVLAVLDGLHGFGQTVAPQAVEIGISKCRRNGLSMIALRNAGHIGRVGDWAEMAAAEGLVSVHFVNASGSVLVAPYGGTERRLSTAPFCVGVPRPGHAPVVLDFATSVVAEGKVLVASFGGKTLPENALIALDGSMGTDPHMLYGDYTPTGRRDHAKGKGAIRAFGEHKGSGLAFLCEILGGSLTGMSATGEGRPFGNGMLSFYVDPQVVDPDSFFPADMARYIAYFKSARPAVEGGEVLIPGEPEERTRADRLENGVPLSDDTWAAIVNAAREAGVDEARIQQAGAR